MLIVNLVVSRVFVFFFAFTNSATMNILIKSLSINILKDFLISATEIIVLYI